MEDKKALILNRDFVYALERMEKSNDLLFVTGRAGTGKSTLLQLFRQTTNKKIVVLAPTGVAALNVKGQTIHSFFGFPPRLIDPRRDIKKRRYRQLYQKLDTVVIDEISMVRADMLDNIDYFLRLHRDDPRPFGGVQMVFFGDLFQLPPVVASEVEKQLFRTTYESPYFFSAKVIQPPVSMEMIELNTVYRQENRHFLRLLEGIRLNRLDYDDLEDLNARHLPEEPNPEFAITLSARNARVDAINKEGLEAIPFPAKTFLAKVNGNFPDRLFPTDALLHLKLNAQVMFLRNDPDKKYVNGTIGKVIKMEDDAITVLVEDDNKSEEVKVERHEWEILRYKLDEQKPNEIGTESLGSFKQFPLRLAWSVTIHKAQGKTFDKVIIDLGRGAFEHGQTYVALSRCRTLDGVILRQALRPRDVITDERIVTFYEGQQ
ncbi:ATP-dependent DNA helicase [Lewinella cohaerens]|uniref:ATP-dependent DNA helicase n=1 Tax=Lewinella cohaerens TaxID=70995 RepID=UPI0003773324|nr:DEAD/DEAH box helicase [Lewinella cohaerens]